MACNQRSARGAAWNPMEPVERGVAGGAPIDQRSNRANHRCVREVRRCHAHARIRIRTAHAGITGRARGAVERTGWSGDCEAAGAIPIRLDDDGGRSEWTRARRAAPGEKSCARCRRFSTNASAPRCPRTTAATSADVEAFFSTPSNDASRICFAVVAKATRELESAINLMMFDDSEAIGHEVETVIARVK